MKSRLVPFVISLHLENLHLTMKNPSMKKWTKNLRYHTSRIFLFDVFSYHREELDIPDVEVGGNIFYMKLPLSLTRSGRPFRGSASDDLENAIICTRYDRRTRCPGVRRTRKHRTCRSRFKSNKSTGAASRFLFAEKSPREVSRFVGPGNAHGADHWAWSVTRERVT